MLQLVFEVHQNGESQQRHPEDIVRVIPINRKVDRRYIGRIPLQSPVFPRPSAERYNDLNEFCTFAKNEQFELLNKNRSFASRDGRARWISFHPRNPTSFPCGKRAYKSFMPFDHCHSRIRTSGEGIRARKRV